MATITGSSSLAISSLSTCNNSIILGGGSVEGNESRALVVINNKPLTNHNRILSISYNLISTDNTNWNGTRSRYFRRSSSANKISLTLNWTMVPNTKRDTADGRYGRDYLKELATMEDSMTMIYYHIDGTTTSHTVFIDSYNENLIRRDLVNNVYYFDCSMTINEA